MFRHRHILKNAARTALAALAASLLFSLGTAHADNRFGDGVGGAMGGTGSFGEGSVTIHHNLLPEERQEIDTEIEDLRDELKALLAQQKSHFDNELVSRDQMLRSEIANSKPSLGSRSLGAAQSCKPGEILRTTTSTICEPGEGDSCGRTRTRTTRSCIYVY